MTDKVCYFKKLFPLTLFFFFMQEASLAQPASSSPQSTAAASTPSSEATSISKTEEQQLRRLGEAIKRIKRASLDLIGECTQPVEMEGEIDIIGTDVIPIMPLTAEGFGTQYLPPRPKYVNLHMQQLGSLIPILQEDINTLVIPDEEKDFAAPLLSQINETLQDIMQRYKNLQILTQGTDYDQLQITNQCTSLDSSIKSIDRCRKKLLHEDIQIEKEHKQ